MNPSHNQMLMQAIADARRLEAERERLMEVLTLMLELAEVADQCDAGLVATQERLGGIARLCRAALVGVVFPE